MGSTDKNFSNTETNGIAERAVRRIKECTSAVLLQSGLDEKWWADSMECYCYLRNVQDLLSDGKTLYEQRFGEPFRGPVIPFGSMMEYHQWKAKGQCTKGNACSFRHHEKKRGKATQSSSPAPNPQTQNDGKSSLKGETLRGRSPSGQRSQRPCNDYLSGFLNPLCVLMASSRMSTSQNESCKFGENVFMHKEVDSVKVLWPCWTIPTMRLHIPG